jgi:hypothetical protein
MPRPDDSTVSQSSELHVGHIGRAGWRSAWHALHRWINSLWSRSPFQKNSVSGLTVGASLVAISCWP